MIHGAMIPPAKAVTKKIGKIDGHDAVVVIHNDVVLQGLSEL